MLNFEGSDASKLTNQLNAGLNFAGWQKKKTHREKLAKPFDTA